MRVCCSQNAAIANSNYFIIKKASTVPEQRASSYLRAHSFAYYPSDRSEYARRSHMQMTADDAWRQIEDSLKSNEKRHAFVPLIATSTDIAPVQELLSQGLHLTIPREVGCWMALYHVDTWHRKITMELNLGLFQMLQDSPEYVVGTLDITIGAKLPAEELIGYFPGNLEVAKSERAYLSNVCVLQTMRRMGIAKKLIEDACEVAYSQGVKHMYVHVVGNNTAAKKLYEDKCGFELEQSESATVARTLNRPKRLLLHRLLI